MRGLRNITVGLLAAATMTGGTVWAQKGKPAPGTARWTLQIVSASDETTPTIVAGANAAADVTSDPVTYDPALSPEVAVTAVPSDPKNSWNWFKLSLKNANPSASKDIATTPPWRWLSFRNVAFDPARRAFSNSWGGYTDNADLLAPVAIDAGYGWPFDVESVDPYGKPSFQAAFMNGRPHPLQFYEEVVLSVGFQGSSFLDMLEGESRDVPANTGVAIWSKRDCEAPQARGIGISTASDVGASLAKVSRQANTWTVQVNQAVRLLEFGYVKGVSSRAGKSCEMYLAGGWWTTPLSYTLILTKVN